MSTSEPRRGPRANSARATYALDEKLWLYEFGSDSATVLRRDGDPEGFRPRFRGSGSVSFAEVHTEGDDTHFFGLDSIYEIDLSNRSTVLELLRLPEHVYSSDWSPDARFLAYLIRALTPDLLTSIAVCIYDSVAGTTRLVRPFGISECTHPSPGDEQSVAWSPDGASLLLVDTCQRVSVYLMDRSGRDLVSGRDGTFGRWFPDGRRVLYRNVPETINEPNRWLVLDVRSGRTSALRMAAGTFNAVISPDGRFVAFDDGNSDRPSTFLFDMVTKRARLVIRGYGAPIWLTRNVISVTAGGPCPPRTECSGFWQPLGRTLGIDVRTGERDRLALRTTVPQNHLEVTIDTLVGSSSS